MQRGYEALVESPTPRGIGAALGALEQAGTPVLASTRADLVDDQVLTPRTAAKRKAPECDEDQTDIEMCTPQSVPKRKHLEVLRDRANTLSQVILGPFTPGPRKELTRSASTRSLLSRSKSRTAKKTSRAYFGSPHTRQISTGQLWSDSLGDNRDAVLKSITARELKRREAIHELVASELQYKEDIETIDKVFNKSLRNINIITDDLQRSMFANLSDIVDFHKSLLLSLQTATVDINAGVSDIIMNNNKSFDLMIAKADKFAAYGEYCANQAYAKYVLDRLKLNDVRFSEYLETSRDLPKMRRMDLWDLLDFPRRRLQRYPLLLRTILANTSTELPEHENLLAAITLLEQKITQVDQYVAEHTRAPIIDLQHSLDFSYVQPFDVVQDCQPLLRDVEVRLKHANKDVRLYLFSHMLLIVKEKKKEAEMRRVVVCEPLRLQYLHIEDPREMPETHLKLKSVDPGIRRGSLRGLQRSSSMSSKSHTVEFASQSQRSEWISLLTSAKLALGSPVVPSA